MKIAIISDVHNNLMNLEKVLEYCSQNKINSIISCGDLASLETLDFFSNNYKGKIYHVFGNMDTEHMEDVKYLGEYKNIKIFPEFGELKIDSNKIAFTHFPNIAKKLAESANYNFVFYGHTHKPWEEEVGKCKLLNPGCVTGDLFQPTFAVWDTEDIDFDLVLLNEIV